MLNISRTLRYLVLLYIISICWQSCNIVNPKEVVPTYIHIDSFLFTDQGSHEINTVWVYYNNSPIGTFDLPATIPIRAEVNGTLQFAPGIALSGRNDALVTYPFYTIDTMAFTVQPGQIVNYTPKTKYLNALKSYIIADFENGITKFARQSGPVGINVTGVSGSVYTGTGSGEIVLNTGDSTVDSTVVSFPIAAGAAFIEFDYKGTAPFQVGLQAHLGTLYTSDLYYLAGINASDTWKKFYLNVTGYTSQYPADTYTFYIRSSLPDGQATGKVLIDNIKLVTF